MLKYIQLINYSIMILDIKICNNKQLQLPVVIVFMYVQYVYKHESDTA